MFWGADLQQGVVPPTPARAPRIIHGNILTSPRGMCRVDANTLAVADHGGKGVWLVHLDSSPMTLVPETSGCFAEGVCMIDGTDYIVTSYNDNVVKRIGAVAWTSDAEQFCQPWGLVLLPDRTGVIVSEYGRHRLQVVHPNTGAMLKVMGNATIFQHPMGMTLDHAGNLVVACWGDHRLHVCMHGWMCPCVCIVH
jgi:sugar lactone lactonase YvrE